METYINQLIENKQSIYLKDYSEMLGDYNRELETIKGYNGRQILELLQNCDDQEAKSVLVTLDRVNNLITVSNDGIAFSKNGYRSLFVANLSSKKSKKKYIGNKGLGFRSIINWSNAIEIQSNNISIQYSEKNRVEKFNKLFSNDLQNQIRQDENLEANVIPMPFLSLPNVKKLDKTDYTTSVIINYKESYFDKIIDQLKKLTPEILLFLKNLENIKFSGFENIEDIVCTKENINVNKKEFLPRQKIKINQYSWYIFEHESYLPEDLQNSDSKEKELYQIKIALEETFTKSSPFLYSYFPTNINLKQPYILHATFDLDSTRNQLIDSEKNRFILKIIVEFTLKVAKYYAKNKVSYRPLDILTHNHEADSLLNLGYYELIKQVIYEQEIFPCIDNTYKCLKDTLYVNDGFAKMLICINASKYLGIHILPLENKVPTEIKWLNSIDRCLSVLEDPVKVINNISTLKLSMEDRAWFISTIIKECQFLKQKFNNSLNILINRNNKIISAQEYIYTPITKNNQAKIPSFIDIEFIHGGLYNKLIDYLEFELNDSKNKSRFIYDQLNGFCNIHSYEPATLAQKIISETNKKNIEDPKHKKKYVKEMHNCLFFNFNLMDEETKKSSLRINTPAITLNNTVKYLDELMLSKFYPTGEKTTVIFNGVYDKENYVTSPKNLGLEGQPNNMEVETYLLWLNINKYAKYVSDTTESELNEYFNSIRNKLELSSTGYKVTYKKIISFESIIQRISLNQLLLWIYFDEELKTQIQDQRNDDIVKNHYYGFNTIENKPSYLKFLIKKYYPIEFENLLIDERYTWANDFHIDYQSKEFVLFNVSKSSINEILILLDAKDDFNRLSIESVAGILNKIPNYFPDGSKSLGLYKRALSHYRVNQKMINLPIDLFADDGTCLKPYHQSEIYFSDKIKLPKQLKKRFPVFNFPSRSGGLDAIKFFGINDLKEISIDITSHSELLEQTATFKEYFEKLKPLILTHRINVIDEHEQRKTQASICTKITIILCSKIQYEVKGEIYEVLEYEFLHLKDYTYFIRINEFDTIIGLRKNHMFLDSFADIISLSFDISSDKNDFKYLIRVDYEDVILDIKNDFGEDIFNEARELLGLADYKQAFWKAVFESRNKEYNIHLDDLALEKLIENEFSYKFDLQSINYEHINIEHEIFKVESLFNEIKVNLAEFAKKYPYNISLENIHFRNLKNIILPKKQHIKAILWDSFKSKDIEIQATFLSYINKFEDYEIFARKKAAELKYQFKIDEDRLIDEYIYETYGQINKVSNSKPEVERQKNLDKFSKTDQVKICESERLKSLLFFSSAIKTIKSELVNLSNIDENDKAELKITPDLEINVINSESLNVKSVAFKEANKNKGVYTPGPNTSNRLKEIGNNAERLVFNYLINNNFNDVYLASEDNEGLHYDIRYTDKEGKLKFIEVKSFDNGCFHLPRMEYDFGQKNKEDYEIWLVQNKQTIIPIKDFFSNPKYRIATSINEYLVHLENKQQ